MVGANAQASKGAAQCLLIAGLIAFITYKVINHEKQQENLIPS